VDDLDDELPATGDDGCDPRLYDDEAMRKLRSDMRAARAHERELAKVAIDSVHPAHIDDALSAYAAHVRGAALTGRTPDEARSYFASYVAKNPDHARPASAPPTSHELKQKTGARW